jgi:hypothetical protein
MFTHRGARGTRRSAFLLLKRWLFDHDRVTLPVVLRRLGLVVLAWALAGWAITSCSSSKPSSSPCGGASQACCQGTACNAGLTCNGGTCQPASFDSTGLPQANPPGGTGYGPSPGTGGVGRGRANGDTCATGSDCASLNCPDGKCAKPGATASTPIPPGGGKGPTGSACATNGDCASGYCGYSDSLGDAACGTAPQSCGNQTIDPKVAICCRQGGQFWGCAAGTCGDAGVPCYPTCGQTCGCDRTDANGNTYPDPNTPTCYQDLPPSGGGDAGGDDAGSLDAAVDAAATACETACAEGLTYVDCSGLNFPSLTLSGGGGTSCMVSFAPMGQTTTDPGTIDCLTGILTQNNPPNNPSYAVSFTATTISFAGITCSTHPADGGAPDAGPRDAGGACTGIDEIPGATDVRGVTSPPTCCSGHTNAGGACCSPLGAEISSCENTNTECCQGTCQLNANKKFVCVNCLQVGDRSGTSDNPNASSCCSGKAGCNSQTGQCVCCDGC